MSSPDIAQLSEAQQTALQTYTAVTDQDPITAVPILQRSEWNVQIAISRFFDGEPASDPVAEARAAQSVPAPTSRQTSNLQYESLLAASSIPPPRRSSENVVQRIDTTATTVPAYRPPFLLTPFLTPFNLLFRLFSTVLSPLSFLVPSFLSRIFRNLFTLNSQPSRRQLPPADTARRFIREFEETYTPNPPLPFVESGFNLALDNCKKDSKFLLAVLLSPSHDETHTWVRETLMSSQLYQFLQTHQHELVLWGGSVQDAEGYQVSSSLNCTKFPFAALICQINDASGTGSSRAGDMAVVMRAVGPMPASELVAKLGTTITAQQAQLSAARAQRAEQQASRSLREEQDSAYERSLAQDRERARRKREEEEAQASAEKQAQEAAEQERRRQEQAGEWRLWRASQIPEEPETSTSNTVRLSVRLPDGNRLIRKFDGAASLEDLYAFVECHDLLSQKESVDLQVSRPADYKHDYRFRLVSPLPRNVIDLENGGTIAERVGRGGNLIVEELDGGEEEDDV
ncbi:UBX domain-containing protein 10 [Knufia obscura]|uniref:UBX domain-containing protein 10 n=2 Tax=Knufia TaxID=430999 RepID=A0AAN8I2P2_9EURO|nr:UBX domain-containing protein 10 [Knufia obscura]KAK5949054.1 UBX domain-containing protein 10 [Knufia fluminis]